MPRFVILLHETPAGYERGTHFDLMLESGNVLLTWALPEIPTAEIPVNAERLADHRLMYLDYEGPLSKERGNVRRVACGELDWIEQQSARYVVEMHGDDLRGRLNIEQDEAEPHRWRVALSG